VTCLGEGRNQLSEQSGGAYLRERQGGEGGKISRREGLG